MPNHDTNDSTRTYLQLAPDTIIGHYRIIEKIGAGGMGEVYLAEDIKLDRKVALKFLPSHLCQNADCRARFTREAQASAKLDHPNIVAVFEVGEYDGRPYFSMQHVEGQTLKDVIAGKPLPMDRIIEIGIQVCEGLQAAHENGITHRDIKPSNILIDSHGRARIVDFGLASVLGTDQLTKTGSTLGTIGYMSPEQVRGDKVDHRTDLFSFGVVLYEMITGHSPFKEDSEAATLHAITNTKPDLLARYRREVATEIQTIIDKALEKDVATRYQHADDIAIDLKRQSTRASSLPTARKCRIRIVVPSLVILGVIAVTLVLKPWRFEVPSTRESQAATNWLAVMYFDNITDPTDSKRLGEIATNLLITGLSQSENIRVMSSQRLYDLLKQMGKEGVKTIDRGTASEIAKKAEAKWMLTGSILQSEPTIVLTSQMIDVSSGGVVGSQRISGRQGENIFAVIDRLLEDVKKSSALPGVIRREPPIRVADVTTHSPEAYRYYLEGIEYKNRFYYDDGKRSIRKAIECDSTFALAWATLATISDGKEWEDAIAMAVKYADRVSERDRLRIKRMEAALHGDYQRAIDISRDYLRQYTDDKEEWYLLATEYYGRGNSSDSVILCGSRALALDPTLKLVYNYLAYSYNALGQHDSAVAAINKYLSMAPDEANPYDTRGDLYASAGRLDSAIGSYRKALTIKPGFLDTDRKLGLMYIFAGQYSDAEKALQTCLSGSEKVNRGLFRSLLAEIPTYQGKVREALRVLDDCIAANKLDGIEDANLLPLLFQVSLYEFMGQSDSALALYSDALKMQEVLGHLRTISVRDTRFQFINYYAVLLFCAGDSADAARQLNSVEDSLNSLNPQPMAQFWMDKGRIAFVQRNYIRSIEYLTRADSVLSSLQNRYWLAAANLEIGNPGRSVEILEDLTSNYFLLGGESDFTILPRALHVLGQAYEQTGSMDKARAAYERFLTIWKDADPGIKEVDDAKARLAHLKAKS